MTSIARLPHALLFASSLLLAPLAMAQTPWPRVDCAHLLALGSPQPAWLSGAKTPPSAEALLIMLNYQMSLSICHQEEIAKLLKAANAPKGADPAPAPKPAEPPLPEPPITTPKGPSARAREPLSLSVPPAEPASPAAR